MRLQRRLVCLSVCGGLFLLVYLLGSKEPQREDLEPQREDLEPQREDLEPQREDLESQREDLEPQRGVLEPQRGEEVVETRETPAKKLTTNKKKKKKKKISGWSEEEAQGEKIHGGAHTHTQSNPQKKAGRPVTRRRRAEEVMHLAVVACGNRLDETLTLVKSALLFSLKRIKFHIFAEDPLTLQFKEKLDQWPRSVSRRFLYSIYPITFSVGDADEWKKLFKPCAAQRLFLPVILKDVDSLLYVDTDVLFLRPMDDIWSLLKSFNDTQLAAMAPEHEVPKIGWYSRFARHPFYGVTGVNSGVMLMNLTRIRSTVFKNSMIPTGLAWEDLLHPLYQKYKNHITWGDQDLLNIIFHDNPECLFIFPCQWNYRPDHCMYGSNCQGAEDEGVSILHGNRGVYHDDKQPAFKVVYDAIRDFPFEDNMFQSLFYPIQTKFLDTVNTLCGRIPQVFLKQIEKTMRNAYEERVVRHARLQN